MMKLLQTLGLVAALVAPAGSARAEQTTVPGIEFPNSVGGFARKFTQNYEGTNPGLGSSVRYQRGAWWADVYVYDMGQSAIPDGADGTLVKAQYQQASGDILKAAEVGLYKSATALGTFTMPRQGAAKFTCGAFSIADAKGKALDSILCVTGSHNKFVKLRISVPRGKSTAKEVEAFINAWGERL